jgi:hypothetical protein
MTNELMSELEKLFQDYGVPSRGRGRRFPDPVKSRILMLIQGGVSICGLSQASGISMVTLRSWKKQSTSKHFQKITVVDTHPLQDKRFRLYIADKAWLELDEAAINTCKK